MKYFLRLSALILTFFSLKCDASVNITTVKGEEESGMRIFCGFSEPWICDGICTILGYDEGSCSGDWGKCECNTFDSETTSTALPVPRSSSHAEGSVIGFDSSTDLDGQRNPVV